MRIDYTNKEIIDNEIYVHDSIFEGFLYKSTEKQLLVEFKNDYLEKTFNIQFYNVLILNCEMCEFWENHLTYLIGKPLMMKILSKK